MSEIYVVNTGTNSVAAGGVVPFGTVARRKGQGLSGSTNGVTVTSPGYYDVDVNLTLAPTAAGVETATILVNGSPYSGAVSTVTTATAAEAQALVIPAAIRVWCNSSALITVSLSAAANVTNAAMRVTKV